MDDTQAQGLNAELIEPQTVAPTPDAEPSAKPPRRRGRRPKAERESGAPRVVTMDDIAAELDEPAAKPSRSGSRRAKKITGDDVCGMVHFASVIVAMGTQQSHWEIPEAEVKPWAGDAAELLNRIPAKYVSGAASFGGFVTVGIGIYTSVKPRLDESTRINRERALAKRAAVTDRPAERDTHPLDSMPGTIGADVPWADAAEVAF